VKDNLYENLELVFDKFHKYHITILLGDLNTKVCREVIFKPTIRNESLQEIRNYSGIRIVNFVPPKICVVLPSQDL
jgi:hypothetical protein